jgi:integrase/recombinase XerC
MLNLYISNFLNYCKTANFSERSLEALTCRLGEFNDFIKQNQIRSVKNIQYSDLLEFSADFHTPSNHVKKSRVWTLKRFFGFLKINSIVDKNIALELPSPKIAKTIPKYLTISEFNKVLEYFCQNAHSSIGHRNLLIIMILGFLGLRLSSVLSLNVEDVDINSRLIWIRAKGGIYREMYMPQILCEILCNYIQELNLKQGPLFLSKRKKRISERTLQDIFKTAVEELGIDKHLHAHLFRHTAATHLNKVASPEITQYVLGHACRKNTDVYTHLNPDIYAEYMRKHRYHNL